MPEYTRIRRRCGKECIRVLLLIVNFVFMLFAIALIAFGGYILSLEGDVEFGGTKTYPVELIGKIIIIFGFVGVVPAAVGCYGAIQDRNCILYMYAAFLFLLMLAQIICGTIVFINEKSFRDDVQKQIEVAKSTNIVLSIIQKPIISELEAKLNETAVRRTWLGIVCFAGAMVELLVVCFTYILARCK